MSPNPEETSFLCSVRNWPDFAIRIVNFVLNRIKSLSQKLEPKLSQMLPLN